MITLSTHILDTTRGIPAAGVTVDFFMIGANGKQTIISSNVTDTNGRVGALIAQNIKLGKGTYKVKFHTESYFKTMELRAFYPFIEVVFNIFNTDQHYHIPLLLSLYGFTTYRGS